MSSINRILIVLLLSIHSTLVVLSSIAALTEQTIRAYNSCTRARRTFTWSRFNTCTAYPAIQHRDGRGDTQDGAAGVLGKGYGLVVMEEIRGEKRNELFSNFLWKLICLRIDLFFRFFLLSLVFLSHNIPNSPPLILVCATVVASSLLIIIHCIYPFQPFYIQPGCVWLQDESLNHHLHVSHLFLLCLGSHEHPRTYENRHD